MTVQQSKDQLIDNIIFRLTIHGAFQRNNIYNRILTNKENQEFKSYLKSLLRTYLSAIISKPRYTDANHCRNIMDFSNDVSIKFSAFLKNGAFNIGTTQKLLNLYWKTNWIFKKNIPDPIHCPFDGIIIKQLNSNVNKDKWTKITNIEQYKILVAAAKQKSNGVSLADWELITYNQSSFIL